MSGPPRLLSRVAGSILSAALFLMGCASGTPATGAQIEVVNGDGLPTPSYLLFDWRDSDSVLVQNRRVPENGSLDPNAHPLAVVRIAADTVADPERRIVVRGMVGEQTVSQGQGSVHIVAGSWQTATVTLSGSVGPADPDGGAPLEDAGSDASDPVDASDDTGVDVPPSSPPDTALPIDAPPLVDASPDLPGPDLSRDVGVDLPNAPMTTTLAAIADSYAEQGGTASGMNFGKATTLEVKTQGGADNNRIAFLRFPLVLVTGTGNGPLTATLRLYGKGSGGTNMVSAYAVADETWTETGLTWNNKPALGMKQSTLAIGTTGQYREWNVTMFVRTQMAMARDQINFAVSMDNDTANSPDTYNSRENASNQPQLVITR